MSATETHDKAGTSIAGREAAPPRPLWHVILVRPETMTLLLLLIGVIVASQLSPFFLDIGDILRSFTLSAE
jgi:rhamnose transport system permease protein